MAGEKGGSGGEPTTTSVPRRPSPAAAVVAGDLVPVVGAVLLLIAVGIGAAARPGHGTAAGRLTSLSVVGDVVGATTLVAIVAVLSFLAVSVWRSPVKGLDVEVDEASLTWWQKALIWGAVGLISAAVLAGLYWLIISSSPSTTTRKAPQIGVGRIRAPHLSHQGGSPVKFGSWEGVLAGAGAVAAAAALAWVVVRVRRRRRRVALAAAPGSPDLPVARLVDDALAELRAEPDPRRAVIRAYASMESLLARRGHAKRRGETPFEHLGRVLQAAGAPRRAAVRLTDLFEHARFSHHVIDESARREAIHALGEIRGPDDQAGTPA